MDQISHPVLFRRNRSRITLSHPYPFMMPVWLFIGGLVGYLVNPNGGSIGLMVNGGLIGIAYAAACFNQIELSPHGIRFKPDLRRTTLFPGKRCWSDLTQLSCNSSGNYALRFSDGTEYNINPDDWLPVIPSERTTDSVPDLKMVLDDQLSRFRNRLLPWEPETSWEILSPTSQLPNILYGIGIALMLLILYLFWQQR